LTGAPWGQPGTFGFVNNDGTTNLNFSGSLSQLGAYMARDRASPSNTLNGPSKLGYGHGSIKDAPLKRPTFDIWAEGHYSHYEDDVSGGKNDGDFGLLYLGADYLLAPNILFGALVQFDWSDEDMQTTNGNINGRGWMVGPYLSARLSEILFFNARGAWGQSDNDIRIGTITGSFDTNRWLVSSDLTGNWHNGAWRFTPSVGVAYAQEDQDRYTNSAGTVVTSQTVSLGRVTFGPEVAYRIAAGGGTVIEPMASLKGLWDFDNESNLVIDGIVASPDDFRGRFEGGVMVSSPGGFAIRATGNYDGIGSGDFEAYGGELWVSFPLN
jgi:outer membrane autotransporter protein